MKAGKSMDFDYSSDPVLFDEGVVARVLAAGAAGGLRRGNFFSPEFSSGTGTGPTCAVGAGVLFSGYAEYAARRGDRDPLDFFSEKFGVPLAYANGVSAGFEGYRAPVSTEDDPDYLRGYSVGAVVNAVRIEWLEDGGGG